MPEITFKLLLITDGADGKLHATEQNIEKIKKDAEAPKTLKLDAEKSLATIRDLGISIGSVLAAVKQLTAGVNNLLDSSLQQRQAQTLSNLAFKEASKEMQNFASAQQDVTNFGDEEMLVMMDKMATTFKLTKTEIQLLTPYILDFTEANKASGMTMESAFDLMGRALNGHTETLGRHGIELDKTRLATEGVSYLVEKLGEDYGGTAQALADLRLQNVNAWGDIKETVGSMLDVLIAPLLQGLKNLMDWFQQLPSGVQGLIAGLALAVPTVIAVATAITTLIAAITALKAAINPVAGIVSLIVGGLTAAGVAYAATRVNTDEAAKSQKSFANEVKSAASEVSLEAEKFNLLSSRMLELKSASELTKEEKQELQGIINTLNQNYGQYLGNINLETASYNQLRFAIDQANEALLAKMNTQVYENLLLHQVGKLAIAKVELSEKMNEILNVNVPSTQSNFMAVAFEQLKMLEGRFDDWKTNPTYLAIRNLYDKVKEESDNLKNATSEYNSAVSNIKQMKASTSAAGGGGSSEEAELNAYQELMNELQRLRNTDLQNLELDYAAKLAVIKQYTADNSQEEITAIAELDAWKLAETTKINARIDEEQKKALDTQKQLTQQRFQSDIQYYSNLDQLGVSSYDAMKKTMEDYYAWAKENLTKEEAAAVLVQLQQTNLRWGQVKAKEYEEELAMASIRDDFRERDLTLASDTYQLQIIALDAYYATRKQKLIEAGITEQQIEKQKAKALLQLNIASAQQAASGVAGILGNLANLQDKESEKGFKTWKALALAQAMVDMPSAAMAAYKSMAGIPVVGPALGIAAAAAAIAAGLKNISDINKTKYEKKALGGIITGPSHSAGGTIIEAEGEEYIVSKNRTKALGTRFMDFLNFAPIGQVQAFLSSIPSMLSMPSMSIPMPAYSFATGGLVGSGGFQSSDTSSLLERLISEMQSLKAAMVDSRPTIIVQSDPLSPIKVSEIAETGTKMRSGF